MFSGFRRSHPLSGEARLVSHARLQHGAGPGRGADLAAGARGVARGIATDPFRGADPAGALVGRGAGSTRRLPGLADSVHVAVVGRDAVEIRGADGLARRGAANIRVARRHLRRRAVSGTVAEGGAGPRSARAGSRAARRPGGRLRAGSARRAGPGVAARAVGRAEAVGFGDARPDEGAGPGVPHDVAGLAARAGGGGGVAADPVDAAAGRALVVGVAAGADPAGALAGAARVAEAAGGAVGR